MPYDIVSDILLRAAEVYLAAEAVSLGYELVLGTKLALKKSRTLDENIEYAEITHDKLRKVRLPILGRFFAHKLAVALRKDIDSMRV